MESCPRCNSSNINKDGAYFVKSGKAQRYKCGDCKRRFGRPLKTGGDIPDGYHVKGQSILYDADGTVKLKWEKTDKVAEKLLEQSKELLAGLKENITPVPPTKRINKPYQQNLLNLYVITDYHLGMMAWGEETGADWDIKIAETLLSSWFEQAVKLSPDAQTAILANIGDFLHWDGYEAVTPASRHVLDADSRFGKLVRVAIRVFRQVINMLLQKYKNVHVLMCDANHDPASEAWLRECFSALYSDEPRVTVDTSQDTYYCYEFGKTSLFFHHGHKRKVGNIDTVFAAKYRDVFGRTDHSYAHMGHLHSVDVKETNLMLVEQHRTLAAPDAYAARGGWISGRDAKVITYHKQFGEVSRLTISPDLIAQSRD